ncbi:MAG TPA: SCO family protein [Gaiellaceae bacterium]|nr:SCO family protein [Gaiellaceae bacterium]
MTGTPLHARLPRLLAVAALLAAAVGTGAGVGLQLALHRASASPAVSKPALYGEAVWAAGRRAAPAFALRDQRRRVVSLASERGRTVVLAFMDPRCKQECPIEGRALAHAELQVPAAQRPVLLIVSVNPRATAADARAASREWSLAGDWHWLLGRRAELARVWRAYDITVIPKSSDIVHSTAVYLIDRRGFERVGLIAPFEPPFVADDLRALAREPA